MSTHIFNEAGMIPGVPGMFAGCVVKVDELTKEVVRVTPLPHHTAFEPAVEEEAREDVPVPELPPAEQPEKAAVPEALPPPAEQEQPEPALVAAAAGEETAAEEHVAEEEEGN